MYEIRGQALVLGYDFQMRLAASADVFPPGFTGTAHVRANTDDPTILATLTSGNGGLVRIDNRNLDLKITGAQSAGWTATSVVLDIIRTDPIPDQYLGIKLTILTEKPVTRGL
jgi:hypothetical protein